MSSVSPSLADLRRSALHYAGYTNVDRSWLQLLADTNPRIDLTRADHRTMLLRWLNSWGCRIRYPRAGEEAPFDSGILSWWRTWAQSLPQASLARLSDTEIDAVAAAYAELSTMVVSAGRVRRTLGPTAAAKALYALRPSAVIPWDAAIASQLHGSRDGAAFGRHLRLGRGWAQAVITEAAVDEDALPELLGRPTVTLAKILDEYLYVTITRSIGSE